MSRAIRWSDNDRYFGPFTYARERQYKRLALVLGSGDDDDYPGCRLRASAFGHTLIVALPPIIKPWRQKVFATSWDAATVARLGRDWYWDTHEREYGFSCSEGFLQVFLGPQTHDSSTTKSWSKFLPWTQWRHVRHSMYGLDGEHFWTEPERDMRLGRGYDWEAIHAAQEACPSMTFAFTDYDGEELTAKTRIEEREWRFGTGWFKWLSFFRAPKIRRSLDIQFSGGTGRRKGSWKGGTLGHAIDMKPGELHEPAFRRYCAENGMTFIAALPAPLVSGRTG
ncbi:hypothetical protein [Microvirga mediterraneensis]|uniref:Uncharacterized protein n=1 Tax=Microvirga mediterraneensis TaxID=2754695 RepID=A0A838BR87_9HYPH|nr:hypothetical protein [Microvirga mediterraneensis]MBA1156946.1 hypothetical protein [Microvirga mediterraneensis]